MGEGERIGEILSSCPVKPNLPYSPNLAWREILKVDGNRNEMQDAFKWQQVFQSLYLQASTLQSICLPLMFSGNDLDKYIVKQTDIAEKDYQV